jgi:hypothetical protein
MAALERFHKRRDALLGLATIWKDEFSAIPEAQRPTSLIAMLEEFVRFGRRYFDFFVPVDEEEPLSQRELQALNTALGRLQREWTSLDQACGQRKIDQFRIVLERADKQAQIYYDRFRGLKTPEVTPVTFLEKRYAITRYVFTPFPLISIPFQYFNNHEQWQALAHELGHYIYFNSATLANFEKAQMLLRNAILAALDERATDFTAYDRTTRLVKIWMNWEEETFADTCGTLLSGPPFVASAQQLARESAVAAPDPVIDFVMDDGVHPLPYLRPLIGFHVLEWLVDQEPDEKVRGLLWTAVKQTAGPPWRDILELQDDPHLTPSAMLTDIRAQVHRDSGLTVGEIEETVRPVVRAILEGVKVGRKQLYSWLDADGNPVAFANLIDFGQWVRDLVDGVSLPPDLTRAFEDLIDQLTTAVAARAAEESESFAKLVSFFSARLWGELEMAEGGGALSEDQQAELSEALLELELSQYRQHGGCSPRTVRIWGNRDGVWLYTESGCS